MSEKREREPQFIFGLTAAEVFKKTIPNPFKKAVKGRGNVLLIEDKELVAEVGEAML